MTLHNMLVGCITAGALAFAGAGAATANSVGGASLVVSGALLMPVSLAASVATGIATEGRRDLTLPEVSTTFTVSAVIISGVVATVVLKGGSQAVAVSLKGSARIVRDASLATGQSVQAIFVTTGHVLKAGDKVIGFVPRRNTRHLLFSQEVAI